MFKKILIANRGEIACRIIRTAKRLGISCVAIYSEADSQAQHVKLADETHFLGGVTAQDSYLNQTKILDIAEKACVDAIHPGYGFLSENAEFAIACGRKGICFIGPSPETIIAMGSKSAAKKVMEQAGIPVVAGYHGDDQRMEFLFEQATKIGYPVLIKAAAGGGGKGMRMVAAEQDFKEALESAKREALKAFGEDAVILEKYLLSPKHIEVQIFADNYGNVVHLFERDCSIQRRHQKIIEETPAPCLSEALREQITARAILAARTVDYVGAGTVEFLLEGDRFYFMEMNTRLQVEHPITEKVTNVDLVEWQLRVAANEHLPLSQAQIVCRGHAIEARIYAEDVKKNFLPSVGALYFLNVPEENLHVRLDTGFVEGDTVTTYYDSMLSKLIAWGETREVAINQLHQALMQYQLVGVAVNVGFLRQVLDQPNFAAGNYDTHFVGTNLTQLLLEKPISETAIIAAAVCTALYQWHQACLKASQTQDLYSPWALSDAWRLNNVAMQTFYFLCREQAIEVPLIRCGDGHFDVSFGEKKYEVAATYENRCLSMEIFAKKYCMTAVFYHGELHLFLEDDVVVFKPVVFLSSEHQLHHEDHLRSPLPGTIIALFVQEGERVKAGTRLMVIEAMKMEHTIRAPMKGFVKRWYFKVGDLVDEGVELLEFESVEESNNDEAV